MQWLGIDLVYGIGFLELLFPLFKAQIDDFWLQYVFIVSF